MAEAYIVEACRTPVGKRGGALSQVHPADLGAFILKALVERSGVDPNTVDDVVAGGVQNMSLIPIGSAGKAGKEMGLPGAFHGSEGWVRRYNTEPVSQFHGAELIAEKWNISREEMEVFALESHRRARQAQTEGRFDREIAPFGEFKVDEGPRDTSLEKMASLPLLQGAKTLTAAVSSPTNDAASALLIASEQAVKEHGFKPRARIHHISVRGADPIYMLTGPINATEYALKKTGMSLDDIDLVEINEAFAPVVLAWQKETGADLSKVNVNGGAIALGHPIGATGGR